MRVVFGLLTLVGAFASVVHAQQQADVASSSVKDSFWAQADSLGRELPSDQFYPRGQLFPFSGFAGIPDRDKSSGYNLLGPVYVEPQKFLARTKELQIPVIYPVGISKAELAQWENEPIPESEIRSRISEQVTAISGESSIVWWYLVPEELRYWRRNEKDYLRIATEAIRQSDPLQRPIWTYEPNHRAADSLTITSEFTEIVGKGCYPNYAGYQRQRVWGRWSMDQQTAAIKALDGPRTPILVTELFQDPDEADRVRIREWVRHDILLGLIHGAKGVVVYSLFRRTEVKESFEEYYRAYAEMARELLQNRKLGEVLLFGHARNDLVVNQVGGAATVTFVDPESKVEAASLSAEEKTQVKELTYPSLSIRELAFGKRRYLFLCNSLYDESVQVEISGFPKDSTLVSEGLTFNFLHPNVTDGVLRDTIPGLGVRCYVFSEFPSLGK